MRKMFIALLAAASLVTCKKEITETVDPCKTITNVDVYQDQLYTYSPPADVGVGFLVEQTEPVDLTLEGGEVIYGFYYSNEDSVAFTMARKGGIYYVSFERQGKQWIFQELQGQEICEYDWIKRW